MGKNIIKVLGGLLLVIGAIVLKVGFKNMGSDLVKDSLKSQYQNSDSTAVDSVEDEGLENPVTIKLGDNDVFTLYPDGTAKELDSEVPMNWQELEGSSQGETYSFIYVYEMEDTSKPRYILTDDEMGFKFWQGLTNLSDFVTTSTGQSGEEIYGDISTNLLVTAIKASKKNRQYLWYKYTCEEATDEQ